MWPAEPDGDPLARFLDSLDAFERLPPDTLVLPSHGLPFRGIPLRVAQLRAHHAARLAELAARVARRAAPQSRRRRAAGAVPARRSTCSSAFSRWARRSPTSTTCGTRGRLARTVAPDGAIRFAA